MPALPKPMKLTPEEYLAIEEAAEFRSEYYQGEMFAMAGAGVPHNLINENLSGEYHSRLKGSGCRTASRDLRLRVVQSDLYTYPDLTIFCGALEIDPRNMNTVTNPSVVFEILSPSTQAYDTGPKLRQYQWIPSVREIVLVHQRTMMVQVYERQADGSWLFTIFDDPAGEVRLASVSVTVPMAEIYRDVEFPPGLRVVSSDIDS